MLPTVSLCPPSDFYLLNFVVYLLETSPIEAIVCKGEKYVHIIWVIFTAKAKSKFFSSFFKCWLIEMKIIIF